MAEDTTAEMSYQLGNLQKAGVLGHWLVRMAGLMQILGFLVGVSEYHREVKPQPCCGV